MNAGRRSEPMPTPPLHLEDFYVGRVFNGGTVSVSSDEIKAFAARYDPQPFHLDEAAAEASIFKGLAASGWHTSALAMRLLVESVPIAGGLIGKGGELVWPNPTRPGDTLHLMTTVVSITPSKSRPGRGTVALRSELTNQRGEPVQIATMNVVVHSRGGESGESGQAQGGVTSARRAPRGGG
jgi:acyl dehydratase